MYFEKKFMTKMYFVQMAAAAAAKKINKKINKRRRKRRRGEQDRQRDEDEIPYTIEIIIF